MLIIALHFVIVNHYVDENEDACNHDEADKNEDGTWREWDIIDNKIKRLNNNIIWEYLKLLFPNKKKLSDLIDLIKKKIDDIVKEAEVYRRTSTDEEEKAVVIDASENVNDEGLSNGAFTLVRTLQIFLHDLYTRVPSEIEEKVFDDLIDRITSTTSKLFLKLNSNEDFSIKVNPTDLASIQDNILLDYEYLETMWNFDKYPDDFKQSNIFDSINRLNHCSFDLSRKVGPIPHFDLMHYSNFTRIFIERLIWTYSKKGKQKQELFRDNSQHIKILKRYFSSFANKYREDVMSEAIEKIIKAFKSFNMANTMNESKWTSIRQAIIEGYADILNKLDQIPPHLLDWIYTIYECTQYYYYEDDDPSSEVRLK